MGAHGETSTIGAARWRVLIIDDHELLGTALAAALEQQGPMEVTGRATSLAGGVDAAGRLRPDLILTDRRLPDGDADEHLQRLRQASPTSRLLIMTGWLTERSSLAALDAGAHGLISKAKPVEDIIEAVRQVMAGNLVVPSDLASALLQRTYGSSTAAKRSDLSRRELDVLEELAHGHSTAEAAARLCISAHTLRNHLARAMLKLGVHSRVAAVSEAIRLGLVSPHLPVTVAAGRVASCP